MKLEKVVKPPRMPTKTNVRMSVDICSRPVASRAASRPIAAAPIRLTAPVAYGTARSSRWENRMFTPRRDIEPLAPPPATANQIMITPGNAGWMRGRPEGMMSYGDPQESLAVHPERRLLVDSTTRARDRIQYQHPTPCPSSNS